MNYVEVASMLTLQTFNLNVLLYLFLREQRSKSIKLIEIFRRK